MFRKSSPLPPPLQEMVSTNIHKAGATKAVESGVRWKLYWVICCILLLLLRRKNFFVIFVQDILYALGLKIEGHVSEGWGHADAPPKSQGRKDITKASKEQDTTDIDLTAVKCLTESAEARRQAGQIMKVNDPTDDDFDFLGTYIFMALTHNNYQRACRGCV